MGIFNFFKRPDIDAGVREFQETPGAVLLDVRTPQEYREGHIPESKNIPLANVGETKTLIRDPDTPVFVYCHSGARSHQAAVMLERMGYGRVKNIGGIIAYNGKIIK